MLVIWAVLIRSAVDQSLVRPSSEKLPSAANTETRDLGTLNLNRMSPLNPSHQGSGSLAAERAERV